MNNFFFVRSDVDDAGLKPLQFRLLGHLSRRAGTDGQIYSTVANMATVCGVAPNTIKIALRELNQMKIVVVERRQGRAPLRRITPPSEWRTFSARKTTRVEKQPGVENDRSPSTENVPPPSTKNAPQRVSKEGPPRKGNPTQVALPFASEAFSTTWADWLRHLGQKRRTPTDMAMKAQLGRCDEWGEARSLAAIRNSIERNYQGLIEPVSYASGSSSAPPMGDTRAAVRRAKNAEDCSREGIRSPVLKII